LNYYGVIDGKILNLYNADQVLALMEDKKDEINAYLKKEKVKFKKQSDMQSLFNYYNQLVK
jgi:cephalosporin hydroxylase